VVYRDSLENYWGLKTPAGSNPASTAIILIGRLAESGLWRFFAKEMGCKSPQRFESFIFRQTFLLTFSKRTEESLHVQ
jgi:hypothetical protein